MRRADRLFQIVQLLRRSRATTAAHIAAELEVSERTVYRDVQDLMLSGVPIQGEAGVGYALPVHFDLPPLMFDAQEIQALVLGARMVQGWADPELARAARSALAKVEHVLPPRLSARLEANKLFVPDFHIPKEQHAAMRSVRQGLDENRVLHLDYADDSGQRTRRDVRPLGLFYWGKSWTLTAWCELRVDFRNFRLDRIVEATLTSRAFAEESGKRLEDFLARMRTERGAAESANNGDQSARGNQSAKNGSVERSRASRAERERGARTEPARGDSGSARRVDSKAPGSQRRSPGPNPAGSARKKPPADLVERAAWREFQQLGSIGPAGALDLVQLGFRSIDELRGQDANVLYERLSELTGTRQDPCVEDALRCAIAQADNPSLPDHWKQWYHWTPLRGLPAGTLPKELRRPRAK